MKIVFLAPFGIRPKGTVIARMLPLAFELKRLNHEVVIVAPPYTNPEDSGKSEVIRGVRLVNVRLFGGGKALGAPVIAWRLFRAALAEKPDLVHLFKPKGYGGLSAMLQILCERIGVRMPQLFLDTDDWEGEGGMNQLHDYSALERRLYAFQESWLPPRVLGVTVASRFLEEAVLAMGVARERVLYLPNCVQAQATGDGGRIRKRLGIDKGAPVLLLYTRFFEFSQEKLHLVLNEVFRRVPGLRILVVGKGRKNEEERLVEAGRQSGFGSALVMAGWVDPSELRDYLAAGDVAIYPFADSIVNRAKCPAKLTELLIGAIPTVADSVGQITEYIDPDSGLLCAPEDSREMAERAAQLLTDSDCRGAVGNAARNYLLERFNWELFAARLNDFYSEVGTCTDNRRDL